MKLEHYKSKYYVSKGITGVSTPFTPEEGLNTVHGLCGCAGKYDCDCVSVVNKVHSELWYEHNTKETP